MAAWRCELPRAEADWLAGEDGPLKRRHLPGTITRTPDGVELDDAAADALRHLGTLSSAADSPGYATEEGGGLLVLRFGKDTYPVVPAQ